MRRLGGGGMFTDARTRELYKNFRSWEFLFGPLKGTQIKIQRFAQLGLRRIPKFTLSQVKVRGPPIIANLGYLEIGKSSGGGMFEG